MAESSAFDSLTSGTYIIDRPVYNSPGCKPLMPGDKRVMIHADVAHLVAAGFIHAEGTDADPASLAVGKPMVSKPDPSPSAPAEPMAPAPAAIYPSLPALLSLTQRGLR